MGDLFRHYRMRALLSQELNEIGGAPIKNMVLGEKLLAFSDSKGEVGIVDRRCPHRGVDLVLGVTRPAVCGAFNTVGSSMHTATVLNYPLHQKTVDLEKKLNSRRTRQKKSRASSGFLWDQKRQNYPIYLKRNSLCCQKSIFFSFKEMAEMQLGAISGRGHRHCPRVFFAHAVA